MKSLKERIPRVLRRVGIPSVDPSDPNAPIEQRLAAWAEQQAAKRTRHKDQSYEYRCLVCLDRTFLMVEAAWVLSRDIPPIGVGFHPPQNNHPGQIDITPYANQACTSPYLAFVACDCHPGRLGTGKADVHRFVDLFGMPVMAHPYGEAILSFRMEQAEARGRESF
ncbi:MAG: hypothetical protein ACO1RX_20070 [Candidatus Sericytochromatia bacterium]